MKSFIAVCLFLITSFSSSAQASCEKEILTAAGDGDLSCVKELIRRGENVHVRDTDGSTAIIKAASQNHGEAPNYWGDGKGHRLEIVKLLSRAGVSISATDKRGNDAFEIAISYAQNPDVALYLLERGIKLKKEGMLIYTIKAAISDSGFIAVADKLIDKKMDLFTKGFSDYPLTIAMASPSFINLAIRLMDLGANPNSGDDSTFGPFMFMNVPIIEAARFNNLPGVQELIRRGADIDVQYYGVYGNDKTALIFAAENGYIEVVKVLLAANADRTLKDAAGNTALDLALKNGYAEIANLLKL